MRLAAIDIAYPAPVFCRILELNVASFEGTPSAEELLRVGVYLDDIAYSGRELTLELDIGEPEDEFRITISLDSANPGRYFDCELERLTGTEALTAAVEALTHRGEVLWVPLT